MCPEECLLNHFQTGPTTVGKGALLSSADRADFLELSRELLDRGSRMRFRAHGRSMHPFIRNGSIMVIEPLEGTSARIGDIIFFRLPDGSLTAHRLVKKEAQNNAVILITRGDSLNYHDRPVRPEQVMGRAVEIERGRKRLKLSPWPGRLFGVLIAWSARGRYPHQRRIMRNLGRLWWLVGGRQLK